MPCWRRSESRSAAALESALHALDHPTDAYLAFELQKAATVLKPYWYPQFQAGEFTFGGNAKHLSFAPAIHPGADAVAQLLSMLAAGKIARENQPELLTAVAALGTAQEQTAVLDAVLATPARQGVLRAVERAPARCSGSIHAQSRHAAECRSRARVALIIQNEELGTGGHPRRRRMEIGSRTNGARKNRLRYRIDHAGPASSRHWRTGGSRRAADAIAFANSGQSA